MNYKKRKMSSCQFCDEEDNTRMVQCDMCDKWSHYDCVGVDDEIANLDFFCPLCTEMIGELQVLKNDFQQQQEKYKLALNEHEVYKQTISETLAATEEKFNSLVAVVQHQNEEHNRKMDEALAASEEKFDSFVVVIQQQNEAYKQTLNETLAATEAKFNSLVAVVRKQKASLKRMAEEASTVSEELKNVLSKLTEMTTQPVEPNMEVPKCDYGNLNDEELAVLVYMKLPCMSKPQLKVFGDEIMNPKNFLFVQKSLLMFGGNVNKFIGSVLNKILSKDLQKQLSLSRNRAKKDGALVDFQNVMNL